MKMTYQKAYEAAQAAGMNETDSHEFAIDQARGSKHTSRPWKLRNVSLPFKGYEITTTTGVGIARVPFTNEIDTANAHLIAAAPDLLEACKEAYRALEELRLWGDKADWDSFHRLHEPHRLCKKATEKAEGAA